MFHQLPDADNSIDLMIMSDNLEEMEEAAVTDAAADAGAVVSDADLVDDIYFFVGRYGGR